MPTDPPEYKSRLSPDPRGVIGSAYAENQARAGAQDPQAAAEAVRARTAGGTPAARQEEALNAKRASLVAELMVALDNGWYPPTTGLATAPTDRDGWQTLFQTFETERLVELEAEVSSTYDDVVKTQDEAILAQRLRNDLRMDPGSPQYAPMNDRARRDRIEEGLEEISFEQMMFHGSVAQSVTIRPGFTVTFRTIGTLAGVWLETIMAQTEEVSVQTTRHNWSLLRLAASLETINGQSIGPDLSRFVEDTPTNLEAFKAVLQQKKARVVALPSPISDDLIVQQIWFEGRVRRVTMGDLMGRVGNS